MAEVYEVTVTAPDLGEAGRLGRMAVERRLAACAQVSGPVTSTYRWHGDVTTAQEWTCVMKTSGARLPALVQAVREAHSYDTPEIIATPVEGGDASYLAWVAEETRSPES